MISLIAAYLAGLATGVAGLWALLHYLNGQR